MARSSVTFRWFVAWGALGAAIYFAALMGANSGGPWQPGDPTPQRQISRPSLALVSSSVVRIVGFGCGAPVLGSGFAVASDVVVTSGHLVTGRDPASLAVALVDGTEVSATLSAFDPDLDLAVLRIAEPVLRPVTLATDTPRIGGVALGIRVVAGEPMFSEVDFVVDAPVIVNWDGVFKDSVSQFRGLRLDAEISRGDSGSGLFINDDEVVGLVHSRNRNGLPRGYAVSASEIADFIENVNLDGEVAASRCT